MTPGGRLVARAVTGVAMLWMAVGFYSAEAGPPDPATVVVKDFMFQPMAVTVTAGSTVRWTNRDDEPHTVVSDTGIFRSGAMDTNETYSFKFDEPGTYHFTCSIHPRMVGTIMVTASP